MDRKFTEDHEWLSVEGDVATVGITDYAQEQLGDLVFVELPQVGRSVRKKRGGGGRRIRQGGLRRLFAADRRSGRRQRRASWPSPRSSTPIAEKQAWLFKLRIASPVGARRADGRDRLSAADRV